MDRTEELVRSTELFQQSTLPGDEKSGIGRAEQGPQKSTPVLSNYVQCANRVSSCLDGNETLVGRMNKL